MRLMLCPVLFNAMNHLAELFGIFVPRIIAAFFKISFSGMRRAFSRRKARKESASDSSPSACCPAVPPCVLSLIWRQL
jgi:hypothetical protein